MRTFLLFAVILLSFTKSAWGSAVAAEMTDENNSQPLVRYTLTLEKRQLIFRETYGSPCPPGAMCILGFWERVRNFRIVAQYRDRCGSTHYQGITKGSRMELVDHRERTCKDARRWAWVATLSEVRQKPRTFVGNPKADCSEVTKDTLCTMQFMPALCSFDGVSAEGSNPCHATAKLRQSLCEAGKDWEVDENQVICAIEDSMPCPLPMCAAPPPGCRYVPDPDLAPGECPMGCGNLECEGGPDIVP